MAATVAPVSREEYLRTTDPDCEIVDGVLEERAVGECDHASWKMIQNPAVELGIRTTNCQ
jgi:hypothetical protein